MTKSATKSNSGKMRRSTTVERHELIVISTAHVPESLATPPNMGDPPGMPTEPPLMDRLAAMTGEYGWLVNVDKDLTALKEPESIVQALKEILYWAKRRGAHYVLFDSDGPVMERFAIYDW